jgi:polyisoprenoid-binding protein YceI
MPCKICIASLVVATPLALLAAGSSSAPQETPAAATIPATTNSRTWKVDDVHSMAMFRVQHMGAGMFWGRFDDVSGTVTTTGSGPDAIAFDITIDPASISSGNDKLNAHLKSPDFFSVKEFPSMTFKSTSAKRGADGMWDVTGDLTMHGVTKSIAAKIEVTGMAKGRSGDAAGFEATFVVDRSQFGMNYGVEKGAIGKDVRVIVGLEVGAESK